MPVPQLRALERHRQSGDAPPGMCRGVKRSAGAPKEGRGVLSRPVSGLTRHCGRYRRVGGARNHVPCGMRSHPGGILSCGCVGSVEPWPRRRLGASGKKQLSYHGSSLIRMRRYSIWPRSPSSPMGPVAGTGKASSSNSPLHVQRAAPPRTVISISFQSCGRYFASPV